MPYSKEDLEHAYIMPPEKDVRRPQYSRAFGYLSFEEVPRYGAGDSMHSTFVDVIEPGGVTPPKVLTWRPDNYAPMEFEHEYGSGPATLIINKNTNDIEEVDLGHIGALPVRQGVTAFFMHNESEDISVVRHNLAVPKRSLRELNREIIAGVGTIGLLRHQEFEDPAGGNMAIILSEKFRQRFAEIMAGRRGQK